MTLFPRALLLGATFLILAAPAAEAMEKDKILVWVGTNREDKVLQTILDRFAADLGVEAKVEVMDPLTEKFQQAAATGDGPDIVLWAHDRFGEWAKGGLISPVKPSKEIDDGILPTAWDAVSSGGEIWGYPVGVEAVSLIYNKKLVAEPPKSFEEIADLKVPDGKTRIMWDYANTYFTFPLMMANGGYAFQKKNGSYDGTDTGVNNAGAQMGAELVKQMIDTGVTPKGVDYGVMDGAMQKGDVAMVINGPWSWGGYKAAGIDFGVAPLPTVAGKPARPFVGVFAFAINAASPNKDLATELIENYLLTDDNLALWNQNGMLGALADLSAGEKQAADPNVAATLEGVRNGVPMPSNPEMGAFWGAMGPALGSITTGAAEVKTALDDAAKRILGK